MPLHIIGISHHTAPIEIRERVAIARSEYPERVRELSELPGIEEVVILGTCNRTEIYCLATRVDAGDLLNWIHRVNDVQEGLYDDYFYRHEGEEMVRHLVRVAGGLDSLVVGESQILGQLKDAWHHAREAGSAGKVLDRLFQHTFSAAKSIRNNSGIGDHPVSVAYTTVVLARQIFGDLASQTVVLVGAGEMIKLCGRHLNEQGIAQLLIVNRSLARAQELAQELNATAITLDEVDKALPRADILISSTASPDAVILASNVKKALRQRRHRPMFMVDIAVPRDIEPAVAKIKDVYLYTIDDLQQVVDENMDQRNAAARAATEEVDNAVSSFMRWIYGIRAARSLKRIRKQSHDHENDVMHKALRRLHAGHDPAEVLQQMASTLTNKILHIPSQRLRQAAEQQNYEVLQAVDQLFKPDEANGRDRANDGKPRNGKQ
jgi:glutamyl-tRNA reductase